MLPRIRRSEEGFGLVELLIAMTVLAIGIMGVASAFISGMVALRRADQTATATVLADRQLERYRALLYCQIYVDTNIPAGHWTGVTGTPATSATCSGEAPLEARTARQELSGADTPDGRPYRIDTYVVQTTTASTPAAGAAPAARPLKKVTVVVRDGADPSRTLVREDSTFECSLGTTSLGACA